MKKIIFLLCLTVLFVPVLGQENNEWKNENEYSVEDDDNDDVSIVFRDGVAYDIGVSWGKHSKKKQKRRLYPHWSGVGFAFANFDNDSSPGLDFQSSYAINWNIGSASVTIGRHWLLLTGVGIDWSRYHFKGDYGLQEVNGITEFVPAAEGDSYRDSKLLAYFVTIPLLLEYQTGAFYFNAGPVAYINCYSKSQIELRHERGNGVDKIRLGKGLNVLPFNVRLMGKVGIDDFGLFGYYSPISLFGKDKGPELYPWGAGVCLNF